MTLGQPKKRPLSVYFKSGEARARLSGVSKKSGLSESELIGLLVEAGIDHLEEYADKLIKWRSQFVTDFRNKLSTSSKTR